MSSPIDPALSALYRHHRAELLRFLVARTGDAAEAEDILQDVWMRAGGQRAGSVEHWRAFLFRTAHNLYIDRLRERRRRAARERRWSEEAHGPIAAGEEVADRDPAADEAIAAREEAARLASAIANLPEGARRAFELHKIDGLSHGEVAQKLGISKSGVEKHMAVAMRHLRRMLAD
ncbi:MAG TPA: RNA polymerase sigma factor [Sphingomonas sp.]|nr:RNA polymerase sigma factor [Sphingomonas sp.]